MQNNTLSEQQNAYIEERIIPTELVVNIIFLSINYVVHKM